MDSDVVKAPLSSSFRDPAGYVYEEDGDIFRVINPVYMTHWREFIASGLCQVLLEKGLVLPFEEKPAAPPAALILKVEKLPFISYPYEWSFGQLKTAALHTLSLQIEALRHGMTLKDASAYNIQFVGSRSVFIDHLSFETRDGDSPWVGYLQFCKHFLSPLVLAVYRGLEMLKLSRLWIDGIPLDVASCLLPRRTFLSPMIMLHIHMHARMQGKYADTKVAANKAKAAKISKDSLMVLCQQIFDFIHALRLPKTKTQWVDYDQDRNYSLSGLKDKAEIVESFCTRFPGEIALDLGANTGEFSRILSKKYKYVIAADGDAMAVEKHVTHLEGSTTILPLVLDLANPSPAVGWANQERNSFQGRVQANCLCALALIHHLVITYGIPFAKLADWFSELLSSDGILILEFVPKKDSQVQRLLAAREDVFTDYNKDQCIVAFQQYFTLLEESPVLESLRSILLFRKKNEF
jgi:hypothetical protein